MGNKVQIIGDVKNGTLEWSEGFLLSEAIVEAEYQHPRDPREIVVLRAGQVDLTPAIGQIKSRVLPLV